MDEYLDAMRDDMAKALKALDQQLNKVRTGRATPQLVDGVMVDVQSYGATMPLNQLATVQAPDARLLVVTPWDKSTLGDIERAIVSADLGLNPSNDGNVIRIPVPPLTQERREQLVKQVGKIAEEIKIRIRQVRREYKSIFEDAEKEGDISEDAMHRYLASVQEATDEHIAKVDDRVEAKEAEVLEV